MLFSGVLHYADCCAGLIRAMRALNDYRNLFQDVPVPSMENIDLELNEFQKIPFENFEKTLFARLPMSSEPGDLLYSFRRVMMATIIESIFDILDDLKGEAQAAHDALWRAIDKELKASFFTWDDLRSWSSKVCEKFVWRFYKVPVFSFH